MELNYLESDLVVLIQAKHKFIRFNYEYLIYLFLYSIRLIAVSIYFNKKKSLKLVIL